MHLLARREVLALAGAIPILAFAAEADDAENAVTAIRRAIVRQDFEDVYDNRVSELFKARVRKSEFIQNLKNGRATVGEQQAATLISHTFSEFDAATGYKGKIYAFDYHVKYEKATFYERLVVVRDPDGKFRLAGIWANPAPG